jgi:mannose-6-phosphate isomerase-like protein (cupin superfamily)
MREVVVPCRDLDAAAAAFELLGFATDLVMPADDPAVIVMVAPPLQARVVVTRARADAWHAGRAGMAYRDLVPDRLGGWLVASHIRIADGGPVADYVHFHDLRAQILFCRAGWVRLVYEDQGEPFVMAAGDCIVQPPRIRHRVLECSPGLEVIEVAIPAAHATYADRSMALPNDAIAPARRWDGQRFAWLRGSLDVRGALGDGWGGRAVRVDAARDHTSAAVVFGFVLDGVAELRVAGAGAGDGATLARDDAYCVPPGVAYRLAGAPDAHVLELELAVS